MKRKICKTPKAQEIGKLEGKRVGWLQEPSEQGLPISLRHCEERSGAAIQPLEETSIVASLQTPFRHSELDSESHSRQVKYEPSTVTTMRLRIPSRVAQRFRNDENKITPSPSERGKAAFTLAEGASHGIVSDNQRKVAFTLAEVLITLGIIGVVAAMTLPTLIGHYKKAEASARLKKFYSAMSQAIIRSEVDNGEVKYWDKESETYDEAGKSDKLANAQKSYDFFMKYIAPYLKYMSVDKAEEVENEEDMKNYELRITLPDSSVLYFHNGGCIDMWYDVNGERNPNTSGYDKFDFLLCVGEANAQYYCGAKNKHWCSYHPTRVPTRAQALATCKSSPIWCSTLLQYDNWEFKDDYPFKL